VAESTQIHHQLSANLGGQGVCRQFTFASLHKKNRHLCCKFNHHKTLVMDSGSKHVIDDISEAGLNKEFERDG